MERSFGALGQGVLFFVLPGKQPEKQARQKEEESHHHLNPRKGPQ